MKKFFYPLLLLMAMTFVFTACDDDDDDVIVPAVQVKISGAQLDGGDFEVATGETVVLSATVSNLQNCTYQWSVNGQKVAEGAVFEFTPTEVGDYLISVLATSVEGATSTFEVEIEVHGKYKHGTFVLNEGNFSSENGKLVFISDQGEVTDSAYFKVNGSHLGHSTQDLYIEDDKMYIISQDNKMGGDGILVVANAETLVKEAAYNKELESLSNPTHIVVVDRNAYIRDNKGIHLFNLDTKELKFVKDTEGAGDYSSKNRMAEVDGRVYVMAGNSLLTLQNGMVIETMELEGKVSGVVEGTNDDLWVSCESQPATLFKFNGETGELIGVNEITGEGAGLSAGWGATPAISAKGDTVYFSNNTTKIYRHIFSKKQTELMTDVKDHVADANMIYNNLAVHPKTGDVYMTTIKGFGMDYLINDISVFNFDEQKEPINVYKNFTSFPAGVFFTESF